MRAQRAQTYIKELLKNQNPSDIWTTQDQMTCYDQANSGVADVRVSAYLYEAESSRMESTACLWVDRLLILNEMEHVRSLMRQMCDEKKPELILSHGAGLYTFLVERLQELDWGALRAGYVDEKWKNVYGFDDPPLRKLLAKQTLCPFSTKYFDVSATSKKYGCTPELMKRAMELFPKGTQWDEARKALGAEQKALADFLGYSSSSAPSSNPSSRAISYADQKDGCQTTWPSDLRSWISSRFTPPPGARILSLVGLLWNVELMRPPAYGTYKQGWGFGTDLLNPTLSSEAQLFSIAQLQANTVGRASALEARSIKASFATFEGAIKSISRLASQLGKGTLRSLVFDFAYYLRRSCMGRVCNASLERVMRIATTDECFPFTKGQLDEKEGESSKDREKRFADIKKTCQQKAGTTLDFPKAPVVLP